jgi:hypothetical protein
MLRMLLGATIAFGLLVGSPQPVALAGGALIETTVPLADRSEASIKAAVTAAIDKAVRGAVAMGFDWFQLRDAQVSGDEVAIQILATDERPGDAAEVDPGETPDATDEPEPGPLLPVPATSRVSI